MWHAGQWPTAHAPRECTVRFWTEGAWIAPGHASTAAYASRERTQRAAIVPSRSVPAYRMREPIPAPITPPTRHGSIAAPTATPSTIVPSCPELRGLCVYVYMHLQVGVSSGASGNQQPCCQDFFGSSAVVLWSCEPSSARSRYGWQEAAHDRITPTVGNGLHTHKKNGPWKTGCRCQEEL